jgi:hypothetical protein
VMIPRSGPDVLLGIIEGGRETRRSVGGRSFCTVLCTSKFFRCYCFPLLLCFFHWRKHEGARGMCFKRIILTLQKRDVQKSSRWMRKQETLHECHPKQVRTPGKQTSPPPHSWIQLIFISSTSKRRMAFGGMTGGKPRAPYPYRYFKSLNVTSM